jgi:hypothetical protein
VEEEIGRVVDRRIESSEEVVDLVAHEGERDVELRIVAREDSPEVLPGDTADGEVLDDEEAVVDRREVVGECPAERDEGEEQEEPSSPCVPEKPRERRSENGRSARR